MPAKPKVFNLSSLLSGAGLWCARHMHTAKKTHSSLYITQPFLT